ncbi:MAG: MotA/TolQ/ExbB proton channel family protein [Pseudomonadales bacterium]|nr:MotA/TolQ/ExbB proton channel family protein [Pseudomonadales bacterium]
MPEWFIQGGPVMWPLLIFSFAVSVVTLERLFFWLMEKQRRDDKLVSACLRQLLEGQVDEIQRLDAAHPDPGVRMIVRGVNELPQNPASRIENLAVNELQRMARGQSLLDTVITMAPMLGILGTVLGIIESFEVLNQSGVADPQSVVGGIAEALITTAAGLCVALLALLPFNIFRSIQSTEIIRLETIGTDFLSAIQSSGLFDPAPKE